MRQALSNLFPFEIKDGAKAHRYFVKINVINKFGKKVCLTTTEEGKGGKKVPEAANVLQRRICYAILTDAINVTYNFGNSEAKIVYDNSSIMYSSQHLPEEGYFLNLPRERWHTTLQNMCTYNSYEFELTFQSILDLNNRNFSEIVNVGREDRELRSFFELLTNQTVLDSGEALAIENELYFLSSARPLGCGIVMLNGIRKQARLVQDSSSVFTMKLMVDPTIVPFYAARSLIDSMVAFFRRYPLDAEGIRKFCHLYHGVGVVYYLNGNKWMTLKQLSLKPLRDLTFINQVGRQISVVDHYRSMPIPIQLHYLDYPAFVDTVGGKELYFPPELLTVLPKRLSKDKWDHVTSQDAVLKENAVVPQTRLNRTLNSLDNLHLNDEILTGFGVRVTDANVVPISEVAPPRIQFGGTQIQPNEQTRFKSGRLVKPAEVPLVWVVVAGSGVPEQQAAVLGRRVQEEMRRQGKRWGEPRIVRFNTSSRNFDEDWCQLFRQFQQEKCQFVFFLDLEHVRSHDLIKLCELHFQIVTQHIHTNTVDKLRNFLNPILKTNCKLGGQNYNVVVPSNNIGTLFNNDKILFLGYDVAHPEFNIDRIQGPSAVGITFNSALEPQAFIGNHFYQNAFEMVDADLLAEAVYKALKLRAKNRPNAVIPEVILVFRDGLGEGQLAEAKEYECNGILKGFSMFAPDVNPKVLFVVATKRHGRRFYAMNGSNLVPGTCIMEGASRVNAEEFYLQSAYPIQGTGKTTDYEILKNDFGFSTEEVVQMTYAMCFEHQIVCSATSQPTPVFASHEYAKRGMNLLRAFVDIGKSPIKNEAIDFEWINRNLTYSLDSILSSLRFNA